MVIIGGVDVGGTKITTCIADEYGIIGRAREDTQLEGNNLIIPLQVENLIMNLCKEVGIKFKEINGLGISTASPFVIKDKRRLVVSPNLCHALASERENPQNDWTEIPLEMYLSKSFSNLKMGNDCVTAAIAERYFGAGIKNNGIYCNDLIYVTWSTGVGAGAISTVRDMNTGKEVTALIEGKNMNALHAGHMYLGGLDQCGCGQYGDLESMVSGSAIVRDYKRRKPKAGDIDTKFVFMQYEEGDEHAISVIENAACIMGKGLVSLSNVLDPEIIIIGGSVYLNNKDILHPMIIYEFNKGFKPMITGVEIVPSKLNQYLGDIAGLSLVMPQEWIGKWQETAPWEHAPSYVNV